MFFFQGHNGWHPLHYVCSSYTPNTDWEILNKFDKWCESVEILQLLLAMGACPNSLDNNRNTPLHIAADHDVTKPDLIDILLDNGAHYDNVNDRGQTFRDIIKKSYRREHEFINPLHHVTLQCLAAKTIRQHGINWMNRIPGQLNAFLLSH